MGREIRRVTKDWQHPKCENGRLIPLMSSDMYESCMDDFKNGDWCDEEPPSKDEFMPNWSEEETTHIMMYETCSEGTPISPAFETPEELARWLTDNNASAFGVMTATYEEWLATCKSGYAPSMMFSSKTGLISGVQASNSED